VGLQLLRAHLHDVSNAGVDTALSYLYREGRIERMGRARYRLPAPKQARIPVQVATGGFLEPPSLARLMAGR